MMGLRTSSFNVLRFILVLVLTLCWVRVARAGIEPPTEPGNRIYSLTELEEMLGTPPRWPDYEGLLAKYLANIDAMAASKELRHVQGTKELHREDLDRYHTLAAGLRDEGALLSELETMSNKSPDHKLDTDLTRQARDLLVVTSDVSAKAFASLRKKGMIDDALLASSLTRHPELLSTEWIKVAQQIVGEGEIKSRGQKLAVRALYKAGIDRERYRPVLERLATEEGDVEALNALFFDISKATGVPAVVKTAANKGLMKKLADSKYPPEIRVACANYAIEIGDKTLAEEVCHGVHRERYSWYDKWNAQESDKDEALARARVRALYLMFYGLRNARAFTYIYDLSMLPEYEQDWGDKMPKGSITYLANAGGDLEIDGAQGLVWMVRDYVVNNK